MVFKLENSCSLEKNADKLLILGMEPAEQSKPRETLLPANYHFHCHTWPNNGHKMASVRPNNHACFAVAFRTQPFTLFVTGEFVTVLTKGTYDQDFTEFAYISCEVTYIRTYLHT